MIYWSSLSILKLFEFLIYLFFWKFWFFIVVDKWNFYYNLKGDNS